MSTLVKSIYLRMEEYGPQKGQLKGEIEFTNEHGEIKVRVNNEQANKIVALMAENLVSTAQQTAALMTAEVLEQASGRLIEG